MKADEYKRLDRFYRDRVDAQDEEHPGYAAEWAKLTKLVLAHGGDLVVPPLERELHLDLLLERMQTWPGKAVLIKGRPSACHENSANLWLTEHVDEIATGYALSGDGLWRPHTWGLRSDGVLVETTELREQYAGVVLRESETIAFAASNGDEALFVEALMSNGEAWIDSLSAMFEKEEA